MKNVLVIPCCNEPGLEIVQALRLSPRFGVVGASSVDPRFDPATTLLSRHHSVASLGENGFEEQLARVIEHEKIDVVFPAHDALVEALAIQPPPGVRVVGPSAEAARICRSKRLTLAALAQVVPVPRVYEAHEDPDESVLFAKPDREGGSRGAVLIRDPEELLLARRRGLVVQEYLPGDEYTVDCVGDAAGELLFHAIRRRAVVGRGIALGSEHVEDGLISQHVRHIAQTLRIAGPYFVQFKRDRIGEARLLEVNARVGGSMGLTRLAGVNIPQIAVHVALGDAVRVPTMRPGLRAVRSLQTAGFVDDVDLVVWDLDDTLVRADGKAEPAMVARLYAWANQGVRQALLTRNVDPVATLRRARIDVDFFELIEQTTDKVEALGRLLEALGVTAERTVMINDSNREKLEINARWPAVFVATPDAVGVLRDERRD